MAHACLLARATATLGCCLLAAACDSYEPPCQVRSRTALEESPSPDVLSSLTELRHHDDRTVASWLTFRVSVSDDFVDHSPSSAEVAVIADDGSVVERHSYPLFEDLESDAIPEDDLGLCWTPSGLVIHWTQDTTLSEVGEPPSIRTSLRLQRITSDGAIAPPLAPLNMDCVDCDVRVMSACHQHTATVLFAAWREAGAEPLPMLALAWDQDTDRTASGPVDWLDARHRWPPPALRSDEDSLLLIASDRAWAVDERMHFAGGPIPLPSEASRRVHWSSDAAEGTVSWAETSELTGAAEVFLRRYDGFGRPLTPKTRLGTADSVGPMARRGGEMGVVFRAGRQDAFAWADPTGKRWGGDVAMGSTLDGSGASGVFPGSLADLMHARGPGSFLHVTAYPGHILQREISCAR